MLWAEAHDFLDEQKHTYGITYINAIHNFMTMYGIDSITEDAFKKNYYRWRAEIRKRKKEVIIAQKNSRASVVNCPFFDRKMFEK